MGIQQKRKSFPIEVPRAYCPDPPTLHRNQQQWPTMWTGNLQTVVTKRSSTMCNVVTSAVLQPKGHGMPLLVHYSWFTRMAPSLEHVTYQSFSLPSPHTHTDTKLFFGHMP